MDKDSFYQDKYFGQLTAQIKDLKEAIEGVQKDVSDLKSKIVYMYGFAAGIGLVSSFFIDWVRTNIFNVPH